jgi:hypothetical protein
VVSKHHRQKDRQRVGLQVCPYRWNVVVEELIGKGAVGGSGTCPFTSFLPCSLTPFFLFLSLRHSDDHSTFLLN